MPDKEVQVVEPEIEEQENLDDVILSIDGVDPEDPDEDEDDKVADQEAPKPGEEEPEKADAEIEALKTSVDELKESNRKLQSQLGYEARQAKKVAKPSEPDEGSLTREQLVGILDQNRDDPETQLRVFEYISEQKAKGVKSETIDAAAIAREQQEIEDALVKQFPAMADENSDMSQQVEKMAGKMRLDNHPFRKSLANAALVVNAMPQIVAHWKEVGRKEALAEKADAQRTKDIAGNRLPSSKPGADKGKNALPPHFEDRCKEFGFKTKQQKATYARMLGVTMEG